MFNCFTVTKRKPVSTETQSIRKRKKATPSTNHHEQPNNQANQKGNI